MTTLAAILILAVSIAVPIVLGYRKRKRRIHDLAALASELGFSFSALIDQPKASEWYLGTALFRSRADRGVDFAMEGTASSFRVRLFDYRYEVGSGDDTMNKVATVVAFASAKHNLPAFELKKKGMLSLSSKRIDLEGNPEFSKRFFLAGEDRDGVRRVFNQPLINFLVNAGLDEKWHIEGAGPWLVFHQAKALNADKWRGFFQETSKIATEFFQNVSAAAAAS